MFTLTWGFPFLINLFSFADPTLLFGLFPIMMFVFMFAVLGWIWSIANGLHSKLPDDVKLNIRSFRMYFLFAMGYCLFLSCWLSYIIFAGEQLNAIEIPGLLGLLLSLHLLSMICIVMGIRFAAKTIKSIELGRMAKFNDYIAEFFLIWFSPVGVWILQPRLNKMMEQENYGSL